MIEKFTRSGPLCRRWVPVGVLAICAMLTMPKSAVARAPLFTHVNMTQRWSPAGHPYMNGGFSYDEQRAMEQTAHPYNLKLLFANSVGTPEVPAFLVIGANDGSPIEKISLYGPWLYIQLPPGSYTILARFARHMVLVRDVHLREGRQRTYVFRGDRRRIDASVGHP